jgi:hypothetical protein
MTVTFAKLHHTLKLLDVYILTTEGAVRLVSHRQNLRLTVANHFARGYEIGLNIQLISFLT